MVGGYTLGIVLIPKVLSQRMVLLISAILGFLLSICVLSFPGNASVAFVAVLGVANAIVWPAIWPLAIHDLGRFIKTGSALLIMAIAGGALLPLAWGWWSDRYSSQQAYWILLPCYTVIALYAAWWYRLRSWKRKKENVS